MAIKFLNVHLNKLWKQQPEAKSWTNTCKGVHSEIKLLAYNIKPTTLLKVNSRTAQYKHTALDEARLKFGMKVPWHVFFRFYPAARVKIANFAVWCPYNETISRYKLRELYKDFGSVFTVANVPFWWNLIRKAFLLHSK